MRNTRRTLALLDGHPADRDWPETDAPTVGDIACYPNVSRATGAGLELQDYPALVRRLSRIEGRDGFLALEAGNRAR